MSSLARIVGCVLLAVLALSAVPVKAQSQSGVTTRLSDDTQDFSTQLVVQPAAEPQAEANPQLPRPAPRPTRSSTRDSYVRLARAPNMFGDTLRPVGALSIFRDTGQSIGPTAFNLMLGGAGSYNVAQNNAATPIDRAYFLYNGFYNAVNYTNPNVFPSTQSADLHLYTAGIEKTFLDGLWSIDVRMPFTNGFNFVSDQYATDSGRVGNLSAFLKHLAYADDLMAVAAGVGVGVPTGSDIVSSTAFDRMTIQNEAIHFMPFVAMTANPNDDWFVQAFAQIDFAATGNEVLTEFGSAGKYTEQNLLHLDATLGRWLAKDMDRAYLTGIAAILELHYTSTLNDSDQVPVSSLGGFGSLQNPFNRVDLLNLTAGLHFQIGPMSNLRVGAVAPLRAPPERAFDSEIQVSFNRLF